MNGTPKTPRHPSNGYQSIESPADAVVDACVSRGGSSPRLSLTPPFGHGSRRADDETDDAVAGVSSGGGGGERAVKIDLHLRESKPSPKTDPSLFESSCTVSANDLSDGIISSNEPTDSTTGTVTVSSATSLATSAAASKVTTSTATSRRRTTLIQKSKSRRRSMRVLAKRLDEEPEALLGADYHDGGNVANGVGCATTSGGKVNEEAGGVDAIATMNVNAASVNNETAAKGNATDSSAVEATSNVSAKQSRARNPNRRYSMRLAAKNKPTAPLPEEPVKATGAKNTSTIRTHDEMSLSVNGHEEVVRGLEGIDTEIVNAEARCAPQDQSLGNVYSKAASCDDDSIMNADSAAGSIEKENSVNDVATASGVNKRKKRKSGRRDTFDLSKKRGLRVGPSVLAVSGTPEIRNGTVKLSSGLKCGEKDTVVAGFAAQKIGATGFAAAGMSIDTNTNDEDENNDLKKKLFITPKNGNEITIDSLVGELSRSLNDDPSSNAGNVNAKRVSTSPGMTSRVMDLSSVAVEEEMERLFSEFKVYNYVSSSVLCLLVIASFSQLKAVLTIEQIFFQLSSAMRIGTNILSNEPPTQVQRRLYTPPPTSPLISQCRDCISEE